MLKIIKNITVVIIGLLLLQSILSAQEGGVNPIVAWVGDEAISADEFIELYEFNPQINAINNSTTFFSKLNFLYTIIAYKLWNQNKNDLGVSGSLAFNTAKEEMKKLFIRDALYRKHILEKITLNQEEIEEGLKRQRDNLLVDYLYSSGEEEAGNLFGLLQKGFPFDTLLITQNNSGLADNSFEIKFGDYTEFIEDQLYALNVGDHSQPIQLEEGYYIYRLKNRFMKVWNGNKSEEKDIESVKNILSKRREIEYYNIYMRAVLNGLQVNVDKKLFTKLACELEKIYSNNLSNHEDEKEYFHLNNNEFIELEGQFTGDELNQSFISFPEDTLSFQKYLRAFFFNEIKLPKSGNIDVTGLLDNYVRDFIIKERLYQIGKSEGLDNIEAVKKYEKMWGEYYAFETAKGNMLDKVNISSNEIKKEIGESHADQINGDSFPSGQGSAIENAINKLANEKINKQLTNMTYEFSQNTQITIDYEILESLEVTKINSFLIRHMGFGRSINGVPILTPNFEWARMRKTEYLNIP